MLHVGVEELKPGMILDRPVKNNQGVLLLEAGARITKKNIRIFKSWGVTGVTIKGEAAPAAGSDEQPALSLKESVDVQLKEKFSEVLDDPVMVAIYEAAIKQLDLIENSYESTNEHSGPSNNNR
jgi:hypothetical protein